MPLWAEVNLIVLDVLIVLYVLTGTTVLHRR